MTVRTHDNTHGNASYLAEYGVRVAMSTNTLVAFNPVDWHGTSLPFCKPGDANPAYVQRGLVIATPMRLPKTWSDYQAGLVSEADAVTAVYDDADIIY